MVSLVGMQSAVLLSLDALVTIAPPPFAVFGSGANSFMPISFRTVSEVGDGCDIPEEVWLDPLSSAHVAHAFTGASASTSTLGTRSMFRLLAWFFSAWLAGWAMLLRVR